MQSKSIFDFNLFFTQVNWFFMNNYMMTLLVKSGILKHSPHLFKSLKVAETGGDKVNLNAFVELKNSLPNGYLLNTIGD